MTTQKQLCNAELTDYISLPLVRNLYSYFVYRRYVFAGGRPGYRFGVVAKCEREKGHNGRCKTSKLKYKITMEWWK
jgi:hypothetical protein